MKKIFVTLSIGIDCCRLASIGIDCCRLASIVIDCYRLSSIVMDYHNAVFNSFVAKQWMSFCGEGENGVSRNLRRRKWPR